VIRFLDKPSNKNAGKLVQVGRVDKTGGVIG